MDADDDKENVTLPGKDLREEAFTGAPMMENVLRTPLHDVNGVLANRMKKAQYSLVTPLSTPTPPTPRRKTAVIVPTVVTFNDIEPAGEEAPVEQPGVNLNSLVCRKVEEIIKERQQDFFTQLNEKDEKIKELENLLSLQTPAGCSTATRDDVTATPIDALPHKSSGEECTTSSDVARHLLGMDAECVDSPQTPYTFMGCLPMQPPYMELETDGSAETNTQSPNVRQSTTEETPITFRSIATSTDTCDMAENLLNGMSACTLHDNSKTAVDRPTCTVATWTEACQFSTCGTSMSPTNVEHSETSMSPVRTESVETSVTPVKSCHISTSLTPIKLFDSGTCVTPVKTVSAEVNTVPLPSIDAETMTSCVTPIKTVSVGACTTPPPSMTSVETMTNDTTPVKMISVESGMSPLQQSNVETMMTPPPSIKSLDAATTTSPFCHAVPRPSDVKRNDLDSRELAWQLETTSISNSLLRKEVESLKRERQSMCLRMATTVTQLSGSEDRIRIIQEETKCGAEAQIDDLMKQQGEHLAQIAELQQQLADSEKLHQAELVSLRDDSANLQQDLYCAYKQRKEEVAELHAEYARKDYKPHFEQAQKRIRLLETKLTAFTGLQDVLKESEIVQSELQQLQDSAYEFLKRRFDELKKEKEAWEKDHVDWENRMKANELETTAANEEKEKLVANCDIITQKLHMTQDELEQLKKAHQGKEVELEVQQDEMKKLRAQLSSVQAEREALVPSQVELKISLEESRAAENRLKDEKLQTEERLAEIQSRLHATSEELSQKDKELNETKNELEDSTKRYNEAVASKDRLQTMINKQNRVLMSLQNRKKELTDEITSLQNQIQTQQGASKESQEFVEAEHRMVIDELRQSQQQLEGARSQLQNMAAMKQQLNAANEQVTSLLAQQTALHNVLTAAKRHESELSDQVKALEEEVSCTQSHAQSLLLSQGAEISESLQVVGELCQKLQFIDTDLEEKIKAWSNISKHSKDSRRSDVRRTSQRRSVLAAVLDVTRTGSELPPPQEDDEMTPEDPPEKNRLDPAAAGDFGGKEGSAFVRVEASSSSKGDQSPSGASNNGQPSVRLNVSLRELENLTSRVLNNVQQVEKCISTTINNLQSALKRKTDQLSVSQGRLAALQDDLDHQHSAQENMSHIEFLALQQKYKRAEKELLSLNEALSDKEATLQEMQSTLESALERVRRSSDTGEQDVILVRESQMLKRELKHMQKSQMKYKSEADELVSTAKRRMAKFEANWKKAESEVAELDDSLDQVRRVLTAHGADVTGWPEYQQLHQLLSLTVAGGASSTKDTDT